MTIVTTDNPQYPAFGGGKFWWAVETGLQIAEELLGFDISKYAELPPVGSAIQTQKKFRKKPYATSAYSKLQTNKRRRSRFKGRRYNNKSRYITRSRQLYRTKHSKFRSSYRSKGYESTPYVDVYKSGKYF